MRTRTSAKPALPFTSPAERAARAAFAHFLDADPAHGPLMTGDAAKARTVAPRPARKAVAA